jgi:hypothetical protein
MAETYFRVDSRTTSGLGEFDSSRVHVYVQEYEVRKRTPKGVWLEYAGFRRFVRDDARKKYACPTLEEAKESFLARKKRQIKILKRQLSHAYQAYVMAERACKEFAESRRKYRDF